MTNDLIPLTGLWKHTSRSGTEYLSGSLGGAKLLVFRNTRKDKDSQPDWLIYIAAKPQRDDAEREPQRRPDDADVGPNDTADKVPF